MDDIAPVSAGKGYDLVWIARPLVTDWEERRLSEEPMDIRSIIKRKEGDLVNPETETTTGG